eukprot:TRINITY_DN12691_c0_g1_i1.p1 TRINITY_DN12691_c0_g1~~TRINITY_DN12691_c0_g1_i1.p1  ORF type:complete len:414 (+),score=103.95 TRINITY_DN12691_c0_g1_i1:153-1244(+)
MCEAVVVPLPVQPHYCGDVYCGQQLQAVLWPQPQMVTPVTVARIALAAPVVRHPYAPAVAVPAEQQLQQPRVTSFVPSVVPPPTAVPDLGRHCVFMRSHAPTEAAVGRMLSMAAELAACGIDMWVSIDATSPGGRAAYRRVTAAAHAANTPLRVHHYSEGDMCARYPVLAREMKGQPNLTSNGRASLAWGFHNEATGLWWNEHGRDRYDFVWRMEDDAAWAGDCSELVAAYANDAADLIANRRWTMLQDSDEKEGLWCWANAASQNFLQSIPMHMRRHCREHVVRVSGRLLDALDNCSLDGVTAWSEMATVTLCQVLGYVDRDFDASHVGYQFSWCGSVDAATWAALRADPHRASRLYHPLKW